MTAEDTRLKLKTLASPVAAKLAARFFKTEPGQYGEGETFIGINAPTPRTVSREFQALLACTAAGFPRGRAGHVNGAKSASRSEVLLARVATFLDHKLASRGCLLSELVGVEFTHALQPFMRITFREGRDGCKR